MHTRAERLRLAQPLRPTTHWKVIFNTWQAVLLHYYKPQEPINHSQQLPTLRNM